MSHFSFLEREWPRVFEAAGKDGMEALSSAGAQRDTLFASLQHRAFRSEL